MRANRNRAYVLAAIALCVFIIGYALYAQDREANDTGIVAVAVDPSDPTRTHIGELEFLGGLDLPPMGMELGGLSGLRWEASTGRLLAISDNARWVWITPVEIGGRLSGVRELHSGPLLGLDGKALSGKETGDSESLTGNGGLGWMIGFERDHRIWEYWRLDGIPKVSQHDPEALLGPLKENSGLETLATQHARVVACAERQVAAAESNCVVRELGSERFTSLYAEPSAAIAQLGGVPTDADIGSDGTIYILFRSYSPVDGNGASIVAYRTDLSTRRELLTLRPPLTVDNFEGLAVREEGDRTFLYIVSDDNFSGNQRTLLLKFEVLGDG